MSSRENVEGIPLMRQGEDDDYVSEYGHATSSNQQSSHAVRRATSALPYAACLIALLSFVFNALNFSQNPKLDVFKGSVVHSLRKPSLYLGIDRVPDIKEMLSLETLFTQNHTTATDSSPDIIHSHGSSTGGSPTDNADYSGDVARVNSRYPDLAFPQDGWVILSEHVSTVITSYSPFSMGNVSLWNTKGLHYLDLLGQDDLKVSSVFCIIAVYPQFLLSRT